MLFLVAVAENSSRYFADEHDEKRGAKREEDSEKVRWVFDQRYRP